MADDGHISHMGIMGRYGFVYEAVSGFAGVVCKRTIDKRIYVITSYSIHYTKLYEAMSAKIFLLTITPAFFKPLIRRE